MGRVEEVRLSKEERKKERTERKLLRAALFWAITQRVLTIPYRHFGTTHLSQIQGYRLMSFYLCFPQINAVTAVAQWLRCCATNRKIAGSIPAGVIGIFL